VKRLDYNGFLSGDPGRGLISIDFIADLRLNQNFFRKVKIEELLNDQRRGIRKR